jgi:hypothetical protein
LVKEAPEKVRELALSEIVLRQVGVPEEVAYVVTFLCTEKAQCITGKSFRWMAENAFEFVIVSTTQDMIVWHNLMSYTLLACNIREATGSARWTHLLMVSTRNTKSPTLPQNEVEVTYYGNQFLE